MRHLAKAFLAVALLMATAASSLAWETPAARKGTPAATSAPEAKATPKKATAKELTLKGELTCAKCGLHEGGACQNVLLVPAADKASGGAGGAGAAPAAGKAVKYYLEKNAVAEANHEKVCGGSVAATVTGRVRDDGGKKIITPSAVKFD